MDTTSLPTNNAATTEEMIAESSPVLETGVEQVTPLTPETSPPDIPEDVALEDEIEDELIIEDFTIDGICGVY